MSDRFADYNTPLEDENVIEAMAVESPMPPAESAEPTPIGSGQKRFLTKDEIWKVQDVVVEEIPVPEWGEGVHVRVKALTAAERDNYENSLMAGKGKNREVNLNNARAKLVARAVVDENNKRIFSDGDILRLGTKSAAALNRIFEAARDAAGMTDDDMEELTGNSDPDQSEGSPSA